MTLLTGEEIPWFSWQELVSLGHGFLIKAEVLRIGMGRLQCPRCRGTQTLRVNIGKTIKFLDSVL